MAAKSPDEGLSHNNYGSQVGTNSGQINNTFHLPPERGETPPHPFSSVPFLPDLDYVERPIAKDLHTWFVRQAGWCAIIGIGGVGKSKLAIELAAKVIEDNSQTWVFWLHASTTQRFDQDVADTVQRLKIHGRDKPQAVQLQLLQNWLSDSRHGRWLLIVDNLDDRAILSEPASKAGHRGTKTREAYIPRCRHGSVLFTSRDRNAVSGLVRDTDRYSVGAMSEEEAVTLLERRLGTRCNREAVVRLAESLSCMPLAMTQAAAYIRRRSPACSIHDYQRLLEEGPGPRALLLERQEDDPDRDRDAENSITRTWLITFEHVRKTSQSAAMLLFLMSFFDRQAIPISLLRDRTAVEEATRTSADMVMGDDITLLSDLSFVIRTVDASTFEMHRLVQEAAQLWLGSKSDLLRDCSARFVQVLDDAFPDDCWDARSWTKCREVLPHVRAAVRTCASIRDAKLDLARLMQRCVTYIMLQIDHRESIDFARLRLDLYNSILAPDDTRVLEAMEMLACAQLASGMSREGELTLAKLSEFRERSTLENDRFFLRGFLTQVGRYRKAEGFQDGRPMQEYAPRSLARRERYTQRSDKE